MSKLSNKNQPKDFKIEFAATKEEIRQLVKLRMKGGIGYHISDMESDPVDPGIVSKVIKDLVEAGIMVPKMNKDQTEQDIVKEIEAEGIASKIQKDLFEERVSDFVKYFFSPRFPSVANYIRKIDNLEPTDRRAFIVKELEAVGKSILNLRLNEGLKSKIKDYESILEFLENYSYVLSRKQFPEEKTKKIEYLSAALVLLLSDRDGLVDSPEEEVTGPILKEFGFTVKSALRMLRRSKNKGSRSPKRVVAGSYFRPDNYEEAIEWMIKHNYDAKFIEKAKEERNKLEENLSEILQEK